MPQFDDDFTDVWIEEQPFLSLSFRSGLLVYTESFVDGRLAGRGFNAAGFIDPELTRVPIEPTIATHAFRLEIDGYLLDSGWAAGPPRVHAEARQLLCTLTLRHRRRPVSVDVVTALDGTPVLRRWLRITNEGNEPAAVSAAEPLTGVLWHRTQFEAEGGSDERVGFSLGVFDDNRWGHEGQFEFRELGADATRIVGRSDRGPHRHPMFVLRADDTGEHFIGQFGWSGGYAFEFDQETYRDGNPTERRWAGQRVGLRAGTDAPAPQLVLAAGESTTTPALHLGLVIGDVDSAVNAMHAHVRRSVLRRDPTKLGLIESGIGPEQELTSTSVMHEIEEAAALGAEVFFLDASWYAPPHTDWFQTVGDWRVGTRFPEGLTPFRDRVHALGMRFGLWMEPERLGAESDAYAEHPEWLATRSDGRPWLGHLNLGDPAVAEHIERAIASVIEDHRLDFFRLDYNVGDLRDAFQDATTGENFYWRYYETWYGILGRLRDRFPDVVFENCASGGARTDLGMLAHFDHTWVTDWQIAPRSAAISNGMTMALPPEYVDRHVGAGMMDHLRGDIDFQARQMLFGRPTLGWLHPVGSRRSVVQQDRIQHALTLYRDFVRPFQTRCLVYHHTATAGEQRRSGWCVLELASPERDRAVVAGFRLSGNGDCRLTVVPRGLDGSRTYRVTDDNTGAQYVIPGWTLNRDGLGLECGAALTSCLFLVEAVPMVTAAVD